MIRYDVIQQQQFYLTPLVSLSSLSHLPGAFLSVQTVRVLLVHGADAAIRTKSGLTCYALACDESVRGAIMELATEEAKDDISKHPFAPG